MQSTETVHGSPLECETSLRLNWSGFGRVRWEQPECARRCVRARGLSRSWGCRGIPCGRLSRRGTRSLVGWLLSCLLALFGFALRFLLRCLGGSFHGGFGFGQSAGGLLVGLDVSGQMLPEFSIEFLGRPGIGERCTESRVIVGLCQSGNDIDAQRPVIHLGHRDEHSAAGEKWHEFNEHRTSLLWRVRVLSLARADYT